MTQPRHCSKCGAPLAADAPEGVCPQCVLALGLEGSVHVSVVEPSAPESQPTPRASADPGPTTPGGTGFTPPTVEELQKHFPNLQILELLGRGGMGAVYKARQPALDRLVALKILPPEVGRDPHFAERFTREARALAKLSHPNIVMVYEFGQAPSPPTPLPAAGETGGGATQLPGRGERGGGEGLYYLIMEFVDGVNLRQTIRGGALSPVEALKIVPQICEALQFAHEEGVVHRDIKPENILLDKRGRLKIADFGLAKMLGRTDSALLLTQTYQVMGTLHYMAPEQFERPTSVDHRADIYSLGVVFYELLTGQLPLGRFALPSEKAGTDARLDEVVLKTLEREPDRRYQHASDVKTDIESIGQLEKFTRAPAAPAKEPRVGSRPSAPAERELDAAEWEAARRKVQGPAVGLIVAGVVNFIPCLLLLLAPLGWLFLRPSLGPPRGEAGLLTHVPGASLSTVLSLAGEFPLAVLAWQDMPAPEATSHSVMGLGAMEVVLLSFLFLSFPLGILMIIGGAKMRRLELYGLVLIAAIAALLPCGPGFVISMPIGIWALVVLLNADVKAAFGQKPVMAEVIASSVGNGPRVAAEKKPPVATGPHLSPEDEATLAAPAGQTTGPGNALVVVGTLSVLFWLVMYAFSMGAQLQLWIQGNLTSSPYARGADPTYLISSLAMVGALLVLYGGLKMRSRTSYPMALTASILAILPFSPVCLLGFWIGIWSFATLQAGAVKRAFAAMRRWSPGSSLVGAITGFSFILILPLLMIGAGVGLSIAARAQRPEPVGTVLVYEMTTDRSMDSPGSTEREALEFFETRVNMGKRKVATLKALPSDNWQVARVEISVFGSDPVVANRIEERLLAKGKIEFAVLADATADSTLITRANSLPGAEVPADNVKPGGPGIPIPPVARWVTIQPRAEQQLKDTFGQFREFATRPKPGGGTEVLVLVDPLNPTEKELALAKAVTGSGLATMTLIFNSEGARKMRTLTSRQEYLRTTFKTRRMGVLIDGTLLTAPRLDSPIADRVQISSDFTDEEAADFASLVNAGPPPGTIKQVSRKTVR